MLRCDSLSNVTITTQLEPNNPDDLWHHQVKCRVTALQCKNWAKYSYKNRNKYEHTYWDKYKRVYRSKYEHAYKLGATSSIGLCIIASLWSTLYLSSINGTFDLTIQMNY